MKRKALLSSIFITVISLSAWAVDLKPIGMDAIPTTKENKLIGISALTMHPSGADVIYLLSDDSGWSTQKIDGKKMKNFARFNELSFDGSVSPPVVRDHGEEGVVAIKDKNGKVIDGGGIDPEGMALMQSGNLLISSEQDISAFNIHPTVIQLDPSGNEIATYALPNHFSNAASADPATWGMWGKGAQGVERNKGIEGITIIPGSNDTEIATMTETPLIQDKGLKEPFTRFSVFEIKENKLVPKEEYAYKMDVFKKGDGHPLTGIEESEGLVMVKKPSTGISDILAIDSNEFIAIERTHMIYAPKGNEENKKAWVSKSIIRLYSFSVDGDATNLVGFNDYGEYRGAHKIPKDVVPLHKELVLDLSEVKEIEGEAVSIDHYNVEGITYTTLSNGTEVLVLVSDNGDPGSQAAKQPTTFFMFEMVR